jgi:hypothetical protein
MRNVIEEVKACTVPENHEKKKKKKPVMSRSLNVG